MTTNDHALLDLHTLQQSAPRLHAQLCAYEERVAGQAQTITAQGEEIVRLRGKLKTEREYIKELHADDTERLKIEAGLEDTVERLTAELEQARAWARIWKWSAKFNRQAAEGTNKNLNIALANAARHEKRANELATELDEARRWIASMEAHTAELWGILDELYSFIGCMDDDLLEYIADYMGDELPTAKLAHLFKQNAAAELSAEAGDAAGSESE